MPKWKLPYDECELKPEHIASLMMMFVECEITILARNEQTLKIEEINDLIGLVSRLKRFRIEQD